MQLTKVAVYFNIFMTFYDPPGLLLRSIVGNTALILVKTLVKPVHFAVLLIQ